MLGWFRRLPTWAHVVVGVLAVVVGLKLIVRPFTSVRVLIWFISAAAILTGATRLTAARRTFGLLDDVVAAGWMVIGVVVVVWSGITLRIIVLLVAVGMILAGVMDIIGAVRGKVDERIASVMKGLASVLFGVLALLWPDITILVVAVVFGARTVIFGGSELISAFRGPEPEIEDETPKGFLPRAGVVIGAGFVLVVALVLVLVSSALNAGAPSMDAFYDTPADVPSGPGVLLAQEPFTVGIPDRATAWRILYTTTRDESVPAVASAIVVTPDDPGSAPSPLIAWAHGTTGVARACAPSLLSDPLESGAFFALDRVLDQGWTLVATDYTGLGTEGVHPYMVGQSEGRSVLDSVHAARQLQGLHLADRTVVWGHSQGGGAALWAGQIATPYAPDVNLVGVAALAPAADVVTFTATLSDVLGGSVFASYLLTGYAGAYSDVTFDEYVTEGAENVVEGLASRCLGEPAFLVSILSSITTNMSVFRHDLLTGPLGTRLAENVAHGPFEMPLLVAQGTEDTIILPAPQAEYVASLCESGSAVDYRSYEGRDHVGLVAADSPLLPELVSWTQQRLVDGPVATTC